METGVYDERGGEHRLTGAEVDRDRAAERQRLRGAKEEQMFVVADVERGRG